MRQYLTNFLIFLSALLFVTSVITTFYYLMFFNANLQALEIEDLILKYRTQHLLSIISISSFGFSIFTLEIVKKYSKTLTVKMRNIIKKSRFAPIICYGLVFATVFIKNLFN